MLDRLGDPAVLGADARERFDIAPRRSGPLEATVLLVGGLAVNLSVRRARLTVGTAPARPAPV
ncbi:hypothetical protein [Plantactinospora sp. B24E8]|uniref:hypothetical protein n=1 Tax=Plantactinospora sp. B24E8 TaxID=3153567 RepID=UPI00325CB23C